MDESGNHQMVLWWLIFFFIEKSMEMQPCNEVIVAENEVWFKWKKWLHAYMISWLKILWNSSGLWLHVCVIPWLKIQCFQWELWLHVCVVP